MTEVRISVHYTKPEGQGVESVDVTWDEAPAPGMVAEVLGQLVPHRPQSYGSMPGAHAVMAGEACRRVLCGHPRANHDDKDFHGRAKGVGLGACRLCISESKCEYFVGPSTAGHGS